MKFQGIKVEPPEPKFLVVPHGNVEIVFKAKYVEGYSEFEKLAPMPTPPKKLLASGKEEIDFKDEEYIKEVTEWSQMRSNWMFIKSLEDTDGLEYDHVDPLKPKTWLKFDDEFKEAGIPEPTIERIKMLCFEACGLNQRLIDEATERFLAGRVQESNNETSPSSEQ